MPGTKEGNKKTAKTLKKKYGQDYFRNLGRKGAISALSQYPNRLSDYLKWVRGEEQVRPRETC